MLIPILTYLWKYQKVQMSNKCVCMYKSVHNGTYFIRKCNLKNTKRSKDVT